MATKLRRSGYPEIVRHQVITEAVRKFKRICDDEDGGVRPIHRARSWQKAARRLEKERKATTWHQTSADRVSAPLIIDPTAGDLQRLWTFHGDGCESYREGWKLGPE